MDKELEERGFKFVRYAGECIILVQSSKVDDRVMASKDKWNCRTDCPVPLSRILDNTTIQLLL